MKQSKPNDNLSENNDYISREEAKEVVKYISWCDWEAVGKALDELKPAADIGKILQRLAVYEDAEEQGRLKVLPCKVGDTIYEPYLGRILERQVVSIVIQRSFMVIYCGGSSTSFNPADFGKIVFLTYEEAEVAMKGYQKNG